MLAQSWTPNWMAPALVFLSPGGLLRHLETGVRSGSRGLPSPGCGWGSGNTETSDPGRIVFKAEGPWGSSWPALTVQMHSLQLREDGASSWSQSSSPSFK